VLPRFTHDAALVDEALAFTVVDLRESIVWVGFGQRRQGHGIALWCFVATSLRPMAKVAPG